MIQVKIENIEFTPKIKQDLKYRLNQFLSKGKVNKLDV